jgi:hypothetical protein
MAVEAALAQAATEGAEKRPPVLPTRHPPSARTDELIRSSVRDTGGAYRGGN